MLRYHFEVTCTRQEYVHDDRFVDGNFDAGLSIPEAAHDIALGDYSSWGDAERIVVNVATLYREWNTTDETPGTVDLFNLMAEIAR